MKVVSGLIIILLILILIFLWKKILNILFFNRRTSSSRSGAVILEMQIPTGYALRESDAIELIKTGVHPTLKEVRIVEGKTIWFFDHVGKLLWASLS